MAYQSKNLSVLVYANGFTLWDYLSEAPSKEEQADSHAVVDADGYFNAAVDMLRSGDRIMARGENFAYDYVVTDTRGGVVKTHRISGAVWA